MKITMLVLAGYAIFSMKFYLSSMNTTNTNTNIQTNHSSSSALSSYGNNVVACNATMNINKWYSNRDGRILRPHHH